MATITRTEQEVVEFFDFLDGLRKRATTNMFGAAPYLMSEFGLDKHEARHWLGKWMDTFSGDKSSTERAKMALI